MPFSIYLSRWVWNDQELLWDAPGAPVARLDLRSNVQAGQAVVQGGYGLFIYDQPQTGLDYYLAQDLTDDITAKIPDVETMLGLPVGAITSNLLGDVIFELLVMHGDAKGQARWKTLLPADGVLAAHLEGVGTIRSEAFKLGEHPASGKVLAVLQEDYRVIRDLSLSGKLAINHHRKYLGWLKGKFKTKNYLQFIPLDLPDEAPLAPATTVSDDFNRANENLEASANWSLLDIDGLGTFGSYDVFSNQCRIDSSATTSNPVQHQTALSGTDQDASIDVITLNAPSLGRNSISAMVRLSQGVSGINGYGYDASRSTTTTYGRLVKKVNGVATVLQDNVETHTLPDTFMTRAVGSNISGLINGVVKAGPIVDTSISSGFYCGLEGRLVSGSVPGDVTFDKYVTTDGIVSLTAINAESTGFATTVTLTQSHQLAANNAESAAFAEAATLTQAQQFNMADAMAQAEAEAVALAQTHGLTALPAYSDSYAEAASLTQVQTLTASKAESAAFAEAVSYTSDLVYNLTVLSAVANAEAEAVSLTQTQLLTISNAEALSFADSVAFYVASLGVIHDPQFTDVSPRYAFVDVTPDYTIADLTPRRSVQDL